MTRHDEKVARIAEQVKAMAAASQPAVFAKRSVSHFAPDPHADTSAAPVINLNELDELLEIDVAKRICVAESGLTFEALVKETLAKGLIPKTVPELKGITIGGAVSGCSVESMSYKYGGFHDACLEYEVVTGEGEILTITRETDRELFEMVHGGYGTLGILTKLTFELIPAKPYVHLVYERFRDFPSYWNFMRERCSRDDYDFVDGIICAPDNLVAVLGTMVDEAPKVSDYERWGVFHRAAAKKHEDWLTTEGYFFRYDADCHWLSRKVPFLEWQPFRYLLAPYVLGSTNLISISGKIAPLLRLQRRPDVVVDVFIPSKNFEAFYEWYVETFDYWPLWIVPYRAPFQYPWLSDDQQERAGEAFYIDCAIYGKPNGAKDVDLDALLEEKVYELGGIKTLISRNLYTEERFWDIYSKPRWQAVKDRVDPRNLFGGVYEKAHPHK